MVTQRPPLGSKTPPNGPVQPQQPGGDASAIEPGMDSPWDALDPARRQSANNCTGGLRNGSGVGAGDSLVQRATQPAEAWTPRAGIPATSAAAAAPASDDGGDIWDGAGHPPGYYDTSKPTPRNKETNPFLKRSAPPSASDAGAQHQQQQQQQQQSQLAQSFARLVFNEEEPTNHNPWQSAMETESAKVVHSHPHSVAPSDMGTDPWARSTPDPAAPEPQGPKSPDLMSLRSGGSGWEDDDEAEEDEKDQVSEKDEERARQQEQAQPQPQEQDEDRRVGDAPLDNSGGEKHVWDDRPGSRTSHQDEARESPRSLGRRTTRSTGSGPGSGTGSGTGSGSGATPLDDWNMIDSDIYSSSPKNASPPGRSIAEPLMEAGPSTQNPPLPPREPGDQPRWVSSRLAPDGSSETYQVKNIQWRDPTSTTNPRMSPILIQNKNGPCPLVALVNALTLTVPAHVSDSALVNVLQSREQVSLNLLLDAVFDELMSPRRTDMDGTLPDVSELYAFLQSLHTGMNVNPRLIPTPQMVDAFKRTSLTNVDPSERGNLIPGTFENTLEMSLYAAFSIPLIHGWLPPLDDPAYAAMQRHAASYEDIQNLLFREEDLEHKLLSDTGLTEEEQDLYQDIVTIKIFLDSSATQLTPWGIHVIGKVMRPGTFAILFRNDHFSTLYCHPESLGLYNLVTDAGYKSHGDIVWESLRDVNGELNEYLSGAFQPVGSSAGANEPGGDHSTGALHGTAAAVAASPDHGTMKGSMPGAPYNPEQEDRDLALALQLQDEEEQKHKREQARRKRDNILSERYIEQHQTAQRPPAQAGSRTRNNNFIPPRRSSNSINVAPPVTTTTTTTANAPSSRIREPTPRHSAPTHLHNFQHIWSGHPQQQVRPLVPPARRPGVNRAVHEDDEPPPPSYEQAAQVPAYHPPPGHPTHPGSLTSSRRGPSLSASPHATIGAPGAGFTNVTAGRRPPVAAGGWGSQRERECVMM